jgi:hypothetical protein
MEKIKWSDGELEKLAALYRGGSTSVQIAKDLNRSVMAVDNKLHRSGLRAAGKAEGESPTTEQLHREESGDNASIVWTTSTPVRTVEDALAKAEVNTSLWDVERFVVNSWEVAAKADTGKMVKTPLWQVKLWLTRKKGWSRVEFLDELVHQLKRTKRIARPKQKRGGVLGEVSIMDHHFGKLSWQPETGDNYDVKIARDRYDLAARGLLQAAVEQKVNRFLFPLGNDFYHVDSGNNTTTGGTPQDCDGRWQKAYTVGLGCVRRAIDEAAELAPVDVEIIPGNHDRERAFTLGVVLSAVYENDGRVTINNSPALKKRYLWGKTLLGFTHGDSMPKRRLDLLINEMAHHWPEDFAATTWREWHLGHLHSESEDVWRFRASETIGDVIVRRLPSLSGTDRWHYQQGYRSLGAAELHLFDDRWGRVGYRTVSQTALEEQTK